jgi:hypothetical protein
VHFLRQIGENQIVPKSTSIFITPAYRQLSMIHLLQLFFNNAKTFCISFICKTQTLACTSRFNSAKDERVHFSIVNSAKTKSLAIFVTKITLLQCLNSVKVPKSSS